MSIRVFGLTGPSGAGKGAACRIFAKYGVPSIDTDAVYHELLEHSNALTNELSATFGRSILGENGRVARKSLAAAVFGHENTPALLHTLNEITHKYVMARTWEMVHALEQGGAAAVLIDAPQLFEAHIERSCECVIGVLAHRELRLARIIARDGISKEAAERRMNAQRDDAFFRGSCHYILENNGDENALEGQILRLLKELHVEV